MTQLPHTLGQLKASGYHVRSVKDEMRQNLVAKLQKNEPIFDGIIGYDETVLPQIQNAILSKHDMLFLGLRGQAKTRMLRQLTHLLDDAIPIIAGSEVNDNPFAPLSRYGRDLLAKHGDDTPIEWLGRDQRYHEKLATPDVTIADLIGEVDMIKHAEGRYLSSELTMHFGLIPRSNRGIFCMNELPDLAAKIQVGLFNVLEERDIQIRGYPIRLELDLCLVFSANPEDYTNRGRIVTPLKDRIGSVIRTHYPMTRDAGIAITDANSWTERDAIEVLVPRFMKEVLEETARLARVSPAVNQASGVSVRMSIANNENMISNAERRGLLTGEDPVVPRVSDLAFLSASTRGKIELTLSEEDGQEDRIIDKLIGEAVKNVFESYFEPKSLRAIIDWFEGGKTFVTGDRLSSAEYVKKLSEIPLLKKEVQRFLERPELKALPPKAETALTASAAEFILEGLHVQNRLNKNARGAERVFKR
ncbi:MAG: sigma 54-interacting transcriptional regulator [Gemmataceae bacterium]